MHRISDSKKVLQGRLTPVTVWGGRVLAAFCVISGVAAVSLGIMSGRLDFSNFLPFVGVLLIFQSRKTFSGIVDEVLDAGDALLISDGGRTERVPLSTVRQVEFTWRKLSGTSQRVLPVVSLVLRGRRKLGSEVKFVAKTRGAISIKAQEQSAQELVRDLRSRIEGEKS